MASGLFQIYVRNVKRREVTLLVRSIHPDSGDVPASATFGLMLLSDPITHATSAEFTRFKQISKSPLARESKDFGAHWVKANARVYIESVVYHRNAWSKGPAKVYKPGSIWARERQVTITVTDPAWLEHVKSPMKWETTAYDAGPGDDRTLAGG